MDALSSSIISGAARAVARRNPNAKAFAASMAPSLVQSFGWKDCPQARAAIALYDDRMLSRFQQLGGDPALLTAAAADIASHPRPWYTLAEIQAKAASVGILDTPTGRTAAPESFTPAPARDDGGYIDPRELRERIEQASADCARQQHRGALAEWSKRKAADPNRARTSIHEAGHCIAGIAAGYTVNGSMVRSDGSGVAWVDTKSNAMAGMNAPSWVDSGGAAAERLAFGGMAWNLQLCDGGDGTKFIGGKKEIRECEDILTRNWTRCLRIAVELFDNCGREVSAARLVELWNVAPAGDCVMVD